MLSDYAELIYGQALLAEGGAPPNPARFSKLVCELMVRGIRSGAPPARTSCAFRHTFPRKPHPRRRIRPLPT